MSASALQNFRAGESLRKLLGGGARIIAAGDAPVSGRSILKFVARAGIALGAVACYAPVQAQVPLPQGGYQSPSAHALVDRIAGRLPDGGFSQIVSMDVDASKFAPRGKITPQQIDAMRDDHRAGREAARGASSYYVDADFHDATGASSICIVWVPQNDLAQHQLIMLESGLPDAKATAFVLAHESYHCVMHSAIMRMTRAGLSGEVQAGAAHSVAPRNLREVLATRWTRNDAPAVYRKVQWELTNQAGRWHAEAFADALALLRLYRDGMFSLGDVQRIRDMRANMHSAPSHQTASVLDHLTRFLADIDASAERRQRLAGLDDRALYPVVERWIDASTPNALLSSQYAHTPQARPASPSF